MLLLGAARSADAQEILIRRVVLPPPTTFQELREKPGRAITGSCDLPSVTISPDSLVPIVLADSSTLHLPTSWQARPRLQWDIENGSDVLGGPDDTRLRIARQKNGATGRSFRRNQDDSEAIGTTCAVDRGDIGIVWSFYEPDPGVPDNPRPFVAFGEVMTPGGRWYKVSLWATGRTEMARVAAGFTEAVLRKAGRGVLP